MQEKNNKKIYYATPPSFSIKQLNNTVRGDVMAALSMLRKTFPKFYDDVVSEYLYYGAERTPALENGFIALDQNKNVAGVILFGKNPYNVPIVDYKSKTLFVYYLMVDIDYEGKKVGTSLLKNAIQFAHDNGYTHIDLLNTFNYERPRNNIYDVNGFNKISMFKSTNKNVSEFRRNFVFRIDANPAIVNLSQNIYKNFKNANSEDLTEKQIENVLFDCYGDILDLDPQIETKQDFLSSNVVFGLKEGIRSYVAQKNPQTTVNFIKAKKILKTVKILKPSKTQFGSIDIKTYDELIRIFESVKNLHKNEQIKTQINAQILAKKQ